MIIFFEKDNGNIVGTIDGRVHDESHMNMWMGDKDKVGRLVVNWIPAGEEVIEEEVQEKVGEVYDDDLGKERPIFKTVKKEMKATIYEPDHPQKRIFKWLDAGDVHIREYKVDVENKRLQRIPKRKREQKREKTQQQAEERRQKHRETMERLADKNKPVEDRLDAAVELLKSARIIDPDIK